MKQPNQMKTKLEIIEETAAYYGEDPSRRAVEDGQCRYLTPDGRMCAVGRCMIDPGSVPNVTVTTFSPPYQATPLDERLREEYRGHDVVFWRYLQRFHDSPGQLRFWDNNGLTAAGKAHLEYLKRQYAEEP